MQNIPGVRRINFDHRLMKSKMVTIMPIIDMRPVPTK